MVVMEHWTDSQPTVMGLTFLQYIGLAIVAAFVGILVSSWFRRK